MCDRVCDDDDDGPIDPAKLVYRKDEPTFSVERWYATHVGCGLNEVGPFDSEDEARLFQAIDLAPLATKEQIEQHNLPYTSKTQFLGAAKWYQDKVWYLVRHSSNRIMSNDRYECTLHKDSGTYLGFAGTLNLYYNAQTGVFAQDRYTGERIDPTFAVERIESPKTAPARLDPNGDAKPLTRIVHHVNPDWCQGPGMPLHNPEYESETGERIPLRR